MSLTSKKLFKIGITGGIGSGKSKLLEYLSTIPRIYTINLDVYGHEIYKLNPLVLRNLSTMFGKEVLNYDKSQQPMRDDILGINRLELGKQAFKNEYNLNALKSLVSPEIKRLLKESISEVENRFQDQYDVIAVEGAVLIEQKTFVMFDELWVTTLDKHDAVKRVMKRNPELSEKNVRDRIERQISDSERLSYASFYYDTSDKSPFEQNKELIDSQLQRLRKFKHLQ